MYRKIDIISFGGHSSPLLDCDRFSCDKNNCIFIVVCCIRLYTDVTSFVYSLLISADGGALHTKFRINKTISSEERSDRSTHPSPIFVSREWCARARISLCWVAGAHTAQCASRVQIRMGFAAHRIPIHTNCAACCISMSINTYSSFASNSEL